MSNISFDDYIDRLNEIPEQVMEKLNEIRNLDKQVLKLHIQIQKKRVMAMERIIQYEAKPGSKQRVEINELLREISDIHQSMLALSKQKMRLSEIIYNCIDMPTEQLNRDLAFKIKASEPSQETKSSKYKRPHKHHQQQFCASEPIYCYCHRPSFGLMVKCQSDLCEVQWFHRDCIEEKNLGDKWFCKQCRKSRGKNYKVC